MLFLLLKFVLWNNIFVHCKESFANDDDDLGNNLADALRNDANLDLSVDEEYEDLRAEFLAYRTALATLASEQSDTRRSMLTTPCWQRNGICINHKLCEGFKSLSQIPGCRDKLKVCCFVWAKYNVRDHREFDVGNPVMPWSIHKEFGGQGVIEKSTTTTKKPKKKKSTTTERSRPLAFIIKT
ncbi:hypothetical protein evm_000834 [Chilo suppressalis]|nr:hypothetical protein evm_000834 [Chilo suppressalis]